MIATAHVGNPLVDAIVAQTGLSNVKSIVITMEAQQPIEIVITLRMTNDQAETMGEEIKRYRLVESQS